MSDLVETSVEVVTINTRQRAYFLQRLSETADVTKAVEGSGLTRNTFYLHRRTDPEFAKEWAEALDIALDAEEAEARRRGVEGVAKPLVSMGKLVRDDDGNPIMVRDYSDTLLLARLKAYRGHLYRERASVEMTGKDGGPIVSFTTDNPAEAAALYQKLMSS